jgi:hypothetical protein
VSEELTQRALAAATAVAARHGVRCSDPVVLRDGSNLLARLGATPIVARVSTMTARLRDGDAWFAREVALASHLAAAGAPVVPPSTEIAPGPHHHDGLVMTFWTYVDEGDRELDGAQAGRALRACHDALTSFDGDLPRWGVLDEADDALEKLAATGALAAPEAALLRDEGARLRPRIEALAPELQAVHGDAHLGNVINGPDGPLWNDWEDSFLGPRGWDLACMQLHPRVFGRNRASATAAHIAYEPDLDDATLELLMDARHFQATVWLGVVAGRGSEHFERLLAHYRASRGATASPTLRGPR